MENQMTILNVSDVVYDSVFIHKLYSNPTLLEDLKCIETAKELFKFIKEFHVDEFKVCTFFLLTETYTFKKTIKSQDMNLNEIENYKVVEMILQKGAEGILGAGWSKQFLAILEMNSSKIFDAVRPS